MGQMLNKSKKDEDSTQPQNQDLKKEMSEIVDKLISKDDGLLIKNIKSEADMYHALYQVIEVLAERRGALQIKLPSREKLEESFKKRHAKGWGGLTQNEFKDIISDVVSFESVEFGAVALDWLLFLFGFPVGALLLKRFVPGVSRASDDIVIPAATSLAVFALSKTHKL